MTIHRLSALPGALLVAFASGCATGVSSPPAAPGTTAAVVSRSDELPESIRWSVERRLTWSDFAGEPLASSGAAAVTTYVIWWEADCTRDGFSFEVLTSFIPDRSWVKSSVLDRFDESQRTLGHEQTHFDISEVHARKLRQALSRVTRPCDMDEDELYAVAAPIIEEDREAQARYDRQTAHGLNVLQQASWDSNVAEQLDSLSRYIGMARPQASPTAGGHRDRERRAALRRGPIRIQAAERDTARVRTTAGR